MTLDTAELFVRLKRKPSLIEAIALVIAIIFACWTVYLFNVFPISGLLDDYEIFTNAARGNYHAYYYGPWAIPLFFPFSLLPFSAGALLWHALSICGLFCAARLFTGNAAPLLFSYPVFITLYFGQLSGVLCLALAGVWLGAANRKWLLAGMGLAAAGSKPQIAVIAGLLWLFAFILDTQSDRTRRRTLLLTLTVPFIAAAGSFLIQPDWLSQTIARMISVPPIDSTSVSAWKYIGPWGLILFIPPLFLRLERKNRLLAVISAWIIAAPYFQAWDLSILLMLLPNWLPLLSWIPVFFGYFNMAPVFLGLLTVFYLWCIMPGVRHLLPQVKEGVS
jgi:hypothetical protein